tara:strand:+ start:1038 stop:1436 length:399 start_codon:yes stop_codon:yes gene_type:complete
VLIKLLKLVGKLIYVYTLLFSYSIYYRIEDYLVVRDRGHDDPKHNVYDPSDEMYNIYDPSDEMYETEINEYGDDDWATPVHNKSKQEEPWGDNFPCYGSAALPPPTNNSALPPTNNSIISYIGEKINETEIS